MRRLQTLFLVCPRLVLQSVITVIKMNKSLNPEELAAWLTVWRLPGVGPQLFGQLKLRFGTLAKLFSFDQQQLIQAGLSETAASALKNIHLDALAGGAKHSSDLKTSNALMAEVEKDLLWLEQPNKHLLTIDDAEYPDFLKAIYTPPPLLFVNGNPEILKDTQIGVVGSRNASRIGEDNTRAFVRYLVDQGLSITSGLALGIDGIAHQAALDAGGKTLAVVANGLDQIYPKKHLKLAQAIIDAGGAVISEFPTAISPRPQYFPRRNRIISGLSQGVLVVEAALKSGSLITARYAMEQGREVFAIPGSIHNPLSKGCHALIKQGAALVESGEDILSELQLRGLAVATPGPLKSTIARNQIEGVENNINSITDPADEAAAPLTLVQTLLGPDSSGLETESAAPPHQQIEEKIITSMGFEVVTLDALVELTGIETSVLASTLIMLELKGVVVQEAGGYTLRGEYA